MTPSKMTGLNLSSGSMTAQKVDLDKLEKAAEEHTNGVNGHS